nr:transporter substrate-binding domain-containing protein [Desulfobacula sp.]
MNVRIKSWWLFVCLLLYFFVPFSGQAEDAGKTIQTIIVVSDDNYPPYIFRDFNGDIQGILVDEWKLWENKTGIKVSLIAMDWGKAQESLLKGQADVIDTIFFTEKRAKQYDFTKPYTTIDVPVFFHKNLGGIIDIESLQGFTIGVKKGEACIEVFKKHGITSLQEYDSYEAIVKAAKDRQIKVFSIDKPPALYYLYKMNFEDEFRYSLNLYTGKFHRAVIKGRTDILKIVEDGFSLITKKEHNAIEKKWMGEPLTRPPYLRYVLFSFLFAGLLFLTLVFLNIALRRKVRSKTSELQDLVNQLKKSENQFRILFNSITNLIYTQDMEGRFTSANPAMQRLFGYDMDEFI